MNVKVGVCYNQACKIQTPRSVQLVLKTLNQVLIAAEQSSLEERAELSGKLLLSLDEPSDYEVERLWLDEAERRLNQFRQGNDQGIPAEEVFRRTLKEIR